ncbi:MAG TPA: transcriptional repressor [Candidatus Nanoarchaeia archaeon]|nr:transcriptional repressor [Candidatus Nanoarchaeia archaeon]
MPRLSRETKQKDVIRGELTNFNSFFAAEDLYEKVKKKGEKIGIATVYRLLKELTKKEELHEYACNRRAVYSNNKNSHSHFICKNCGKTAHIEVKDINFIKKKIKGSVCHFQIDIYGICEKCLEIRK